ncbi:Uncharacterized protein OS=Methanocella conradii (strain DSM 24694 / JCM 17849 / CGMCC 1.5162 / HZ254) GN=Mtc_0874 PE=4 SV=1 [Gemmata massiliana]|uniref:Antitoxin SocA-like Panacea domain-containing protein n=1 Tax=Gemmata massiliana TaxID=1210884 RepID=A0A6P2CQI3_9BACT|nr:hypothetical protein [Gemmata massiliana]VTR91109.1 Uncharacterized protein OS=Methanocella conradii (strain DSM 24694 / JCM 17849 / CGMCC 1.5162 / HZ254) GN=Mtc_0874 PE=4 SV=1 [Gemmata massiliana]
MTTYDFVHLVIYAVGGQIQGRTKLQKTVYFVGVLTGKIQDLGYRSHYYGPFSPAVAGAVQELRGLKFLEQHVSTGDAFDENEFEMTRYDYALTPEGTQIAEEKTIQQAGEWEQIRAAIRRLEAANIPDYVRLAIAAKTDLLTRQGGEHFPADVLKQKTAEHGWKAFTEEQYFDALRFLQTVIGCRLEPVSVCGAST